MKTMRIVMISAQSGAQSGAQNLLGLIKRAATILGLFCLIFSWSVTLSSHSFALEPDEVFHDNPELEQRARQLSAELRCVVCQNQNIDESDATIAKDMRLILRQRLLAGDNDQEIKDFFVTRYGDYVLFKPRWSLSTAALWLSPFISLGLGLMAWFVFFRARTREQQDQGADTAVTQQALSLQEEQELERYLQQADLQAKPNKGKS